MNCLEFNWLKQNITSCANELICENMNLSESNVLLYTEGVNVTYQILHTLLKMKLQQLEQLNWK